MVWGTAVWAVRDGPDGPRVSHTRLKAIYITFFLIPYYLSISSIMPKLIFYILIHYYFLLINKVIETNRQKNICLITK